MSRYKALGQAAARLIKDFGKQATIARNKSTNNPITGEVTESAGAVLVVNVVEVSYSQAFGGSQDNAEEGALYLLADNSQRLELGDKIKFDDAEHFIQKLNPMRPGGEVLAYGVEVTK